jgi:hypothetical protein
MCGIHNQRLAAVVGRNLENRLIAIKQDIFAGNFLATAVDVLINDGLISD